MYMCVGVAVDVGGKVIERGAGADGKRYTCYYYYYQYYYYHYYYHYHYCYYYYYYYYNYYCCYYCYYPKMPTLLGW